MSDDTPGAGEYPDTDADDVNVEEVVQSEPLVQLWGDHAKTRFVNALLRAYPEPLNPSRITNAAGLSHQPWYDYRDELLSTGIVVESGNAGNSTLYKINPAVADDLKKLRSLAGAGLRGEGIEEIVDDVEGDGDE